MSLIELTIPPREADIGDLLVRRLLPYMKRRTLGPFIFLDHMGPKHYDAGHGLDVRPHPHIGLATLTYLFDGEILHRDTLGSHQAITPGAVNWMIAGSGIAHSERIDHAERVHANDVHGLQFWIALPKEFEEKSPEFEHYEASKIPVLESPGVRMKVIAGSAFGEHAPVKIHSPLFYVEVHMNAGRHIDLPPQYRERGLYLIDGNIRVGGEDVMPHTLPVFLPDGTVRIEAVTDTHFVLLGGEPLPEKRFIWWNFVSSSQERIEQAKDDWAKGRFGDIPGDKNDALPLPPDRVKSGK